MDGTGRVVKPKWRLNVDRAICAGTGACTALSDAFALGPDYKSSPTKEVSKTDPLLLSAARACPVDAISIVDIETGELVYPSNR
jgi:ferredoxin